MPAAASTRQRWFSSSTGGTPLPGECPPGGCHPALPPPDHPQGRQQGQQAPPGQQPLAQLGQLGQQQFGCQAPAVPAAQQALFDRQLLVDTLSTVSGGRAASHACWLAEVAA